MTCTIRPTVTARSCLKKINGRKDKHMNTKLNRVIEEIDKIEKKISEWQTQLRQLKMQRKQLEDQEIIKSIRSMQLTDADMLRMLYGIQDGSVRFTDETEKQKSSGKEKAAESEKIENEELD